MAPWAALRGAAADLGTQLVLVVAAWVAVALLPGQQSADQAISILVFAAGVVAAALLSLSGAVNANHRARWIGAAVGVFTCVTLLLQALGAASGGGLGHLAGSVTILAVVGLLVLSVRRAGDPRAAVGVLLLVALGAAALTVSGLLAPGLVPPPGLVAGADLVAWSGAGATGVLLLLAGTATDRPLLRRAGLAFATLGVANAVRIVESAGLTAARPVPVGALEVGAVAMLLLAAIRFAVLVVGEARGPEAAVVRDPEHDHEVADAAPADVGRVLRDLAVVHEDGGTDIRVEVDGEPHVAIDAGVLAQAVTNLLVNCAQHAPGARVWLRAWRGDRRVRIEVADDGPGLPRYTTAALLRHDLRAAGPGLGLLRTAELVERHGGTFTVVSGKGCRVVLDLPPARPDTAIPLGA